MPSVPLQLTVPFTESVNPPRSRPVLFDTTRLLHDSFWLSVIACVDRIVTSSPAPGTPFGVQVVAVLQLPVAALVYAVAQAELAPSRHTNAAPTSAVSAVVKRARDVMDDPRRDAGAVPLRSPWVGMETEDAERRSPPEKPVGRRPEWGMVELWSL